MVGYERRIRIFIQTFNNNKDILNKNTRELTCFIQTVYRAVKSQ